MTGLVVDASAALALLLATNGRDEVRGHLREQVLRGGSLLVPAVFWVHVLDGLIARGRARPTLVVEAVYELDQLGLETAEVGRPGILALVDAIGRGVSAAQAPYLVLAESADVRLLTADALLAAVAADRAVLVGSSGGRRRIRRPSGDQSWARWRGAATYLRELRARL